MHLKSNENLVSRNNKFCNENNRSDLLKKHEMIAKINKITGELYYEKVIGADKETITTTEKQKDRNFLSKKKYIENACNQMDITYINKSMILIGQCWRNRTEKLSKRNNIDEMVEFLNEMYDKKYMLYRFGNSDSDSERFLNVQLFPSISYSIPLVLSICKSVKGWSTLNNDNIVVFEMRGNKLKLAFVVCCVMKYCGFSSSIQDALNYFIEKSHYRANEFRNLTFIRYLEHFESIIMKNSTETKYFQIKIHQIIITTIPKLGTNQECIPQFDFYQNGCLYKTINSNSKNCNIIKDENYIILNLNDFVVSGDIMISMNHIDKKSMIPGFELYTNTFAYKHGLYRFDRNKLEYSYSTDVRNKKFDKDFTVDIVFYENEKINLKLPYHWENSFIENIKILSEHFHREPDSNILKNLIEQGYNRICSKMCVQLGYNIDQSKKIIECLSLIGISDLYQKKKGNIQDKIFKVISPPVELSPEPKPKIEKIEEKNDDIKQKSDLSSIYINNEILDFQNLEVIPERIEVNVPKKKTQTKIRLPPKKVAIKEVTEQELAVRKPLHWISVPHTEESIFNELNEIKVNIDYTKFEEWFCEPTKTLSKNSIIEKEHSVLKDPRRVFLVSIAMKTLEKKKINISNLLEIIYKNSEILDNEDLHNINRILPTEFESTILKNIKDKNLELNVIESFMLSISKDEEIKKIVEILIFERKFFEEVYLIERGLDEMKTLFNKILESNNLRIILKMILELGNAVNYKYSSKLRKKAFGFRLSSMYAFYTFKGKHKDHNLFKFLMLTIIKNKPELFEITIELMSIHKIKNEDLLSIRDRINGFILFYQKCTSIIDILNPKKHVVGRLKKFIGYVYIKLSNMIDLYKECYVYGSLIKRKFHEDEKCSINEILSILSNFLIKMEEQERCDI